MTQLIYEARPTLLTTSVDNYTFDGVYYATHVMLSSDAAVNITGVDAAVRMKAKRWYNTTGFAITLKHQDSASDAANQWFSATGSDVVISANGGWVDSYLDTTSGYWRI